MRIYIISLLIFLFFNCTPKGETRTHEEKTSKKTTDSTVYTDYTNDWNSPKVTKLPINGINPEFTLDENIILYRALDKTSLKKYNLKSDEDIILINNLSSYRNHERIGDIIVLETKPPNQKVEQISINDGNIKVPRPNKSYTELCENLKLKESKNDRFARLVSDLSGIEIITAKGVEFKLAPDGNKNYIEAELSPEGDYLAYKVSGIEGFITDLKGDKVRSLGDVNHIQWVDNMHVVYTLQEDDGMQTLASEIYVHNIQNNKRILISDTIEEDLYHPMPSPSKNHILAHSLEGNIYIFNFTK